LENRFVVTFFDIKLSRVV